VSRPQFVDHLVFRVSDVERTEKFYSVFLGPPIGRVSGSIAYEVGETKIFFTACTATHLHRPDKEQVGLNHLAFGVRKTEELRRIEAKLNRSKLRNSGIQIDRYGSKEFIWFEDPDGTRLEFYLRERGDVS